MWRNFNDIDDSWQSVSGIIDYYAENNFNMSSYAGPGGWNDPDEVCVILIPDRKHIHMHMDAVDMPFHYFVSMCMYIKIKKRCVRVIIDLYKMYIYTHLAKS